MKISTFIVGSNKEQDETLIALEKGWYEDVFGKAVKNFEEAKSQGILNMFLTSSSSSIFIKAQEDQSEIINYYVIFKSGAFKKIDEQKYLDEITK